MYLSDVRKKKKRHTVPKATAITNGELKLSHHMKQTQGTREVVVIDILKFIYSVLLSFGSI